MSIRKLWHDPVLSKVIAGVISVLATAVWGYSHNWFQPIGAFLLQIYSLALSKSNVPNWLLVIMLTITFLVVLSFLAILWKVVFPSIRGETWKSYTTDTFFGIKWRWEYFDSGGIYNLVTFCPDCGYQVYAKNISAFRAIDHIGFQCESCGKPMGDFEMSSDALNNRVERYIHQKIRNGAWKKEG